mgnify:CR=1 FL=1
MMRMLRATESTLSSGYRKAPASAVESPCPSSVASSAFRQACNVPDGARLLIVSDRGSRGRAVRFNKPGLLIGRHSECDIRIAHPSVSRYHAFVQAMDDYICVNDLGSRTGIVAYDRIQGAAWLRPGDHFRIGPEVLRFESTQAREEGGTTALGLLRDERSSPLFRLEFANGRSPGGVSGWLVDRRITLIGAHPLCKLQLQHETVRRFHAALICTGQQLWITRIGANASVDVDGASCETVELQPGAEISIGRFRFRVAIDMDAAAIRLAEETAVESTLVSYSD